MDMCYGNFLSNVRQIEMMISRLQTDVKGFMLTVTKIVSSLLQNMNSLSLEHLTTQQKSIFYVLDAVVGLLAF